MVRSRRPPRPPRPHRAHLHPSPPAPPAPHSDGVAQLPHALHGRLVCELPAVARLAAPHARHGAPLPRLRAGHPLSAGDAAHIREQHPPPRPSPLPACCSRRSGAAAL
eukprot:3858864-Prymnesium_polylepis.2